MLGRGVVIAAGAVVWLALSGSALAATESVDCSTDHAALRTSIGTAGAGDILLVHGYCMGPFRLNKSLTLRGDPSATLDGGGKGSTISVDQFVTARLIRLTITGGSFFDGGGVFSTNPSHVILVNSTVRGNHASADGGGMAIGGTLSMHNSTVNANSSAGIGGGISAGGITSADFQTPGLVTIVNSTISGNRARQSGGGILLDGSPVSIRLTTISANTAGDQAGGILVLSGNQPVEPDSISGSILAGNTAGTSNQDCLIYNFGFAPIVSGGFNVAGSSCGFHTIGDVTADGAPSTFGLGPLGWNGGRTKTMPLTNNSIAVDHIPPNTTTPDNHPLCTIDLTDQRGVRRPQGPACDTGAFELRP